jgi:hypothetical protein
LAIILFAVVTASPGTISFSKTKKLPKMPSIKTIRYPNPAILAALRNDISLIDAVFCLEFIFLF